MPTKTCSVIGIRTIPKEKIEYVKEKLREEIMSAVAEGYTNFISGFAEGTDLLFAENVVELKKENPKIKLEAEIPYRKKLATKNKLFQKLLAECDGVNIVSEEYFAACLMKRNRLVAQKSTLVIAVYDGNEKGAVLATMQYAHYIGKHVKVIEV